MKRLILLILLSAAPAIAVETPYLDYLSGKETPTEKRVRELEEKTQQLERKIEELRREVELNQSLIQSQIEEMQPKKTQHIYPLIRQ